MANNEEDNSAALVTFKSQVAVSIEMVPRMSKDQQSQAWQFWQYVSKHLHRIITGAIGQPSGTENDKASVGLMCVDEQTSQDNVLESETCTATKPQSQLLRTVAMEPEIKKSQSDEGLGIVLSNEPILIGTTLPLQNSTGTIIPGPNSTGTTIPGQNSTGTTIPGQNSTGTTIPGQNGTGTTIPGPNSTGTTIPNSIGTFTLDPNSVTSDVGYVEKETSDTCMKEINIVIEARPMESLSHDKRETAIVQPPKRQRRLTKSGAESGRVRRNKAAKDSSVALGRPATKAKAKSDRRVNRGKKDADSSHLGEHEGNSVLAAIHEANQTLKVGTADVNETMDNESLNDEEETEKISKKNLGSPGRSTCEYCGKTFSNNSGLLVHLRVHTGEKPYLCSICNKGFTTKCNVRRHEATHAGLKPFQCEECQKYFTEKKSLKVHMRIHTGERPYRCDVCGRTFAQVGILRTHMHLHTGFKGHLCDHCGKSFRQKTNLRSHLLRHANKRQFKCETCPASFICAADLKRHCQKHTGERPFLCWLCPKTFTRLQYLKEHINQHTGNKPYCCKKCNAAFPDLSSVHKHMKKQHNLKKQPPARNPTPATVPADEGVLRSKVYSQPFYMQVADGCPIQPGTLVTVTDASGLPLQQKDFTLAGACTAYATEEQEVKMSVMNITQPASSQTFENTTNADIMYIPIHDVAKTEIVYDDSNMVASDVTVDFSAISLLASASAQADPATEIQNDF